MGRPAYRITTNDFEAAHAYLMKHHYSGKPWLRKISDPEELQQFCDDELKPEEWKRLKATILQERKRGKDEAKGRKVKTINLTERAFKELNTLQFKLKDAGYEVTYSELIKAMAEKFAGNTAAGAARELEIQRELF